MVNFFVNTQKLKVGECIEVLGKHSWGGACGLHGFIWFRACVCLSVLYLALLTNLPLAEIGLATATGALIALPLGVMGGWICDRFSSKFGMVMNNVLAAAGFCIYLIADNFAFVLSAVLLVSIGGRIYWAA